MTAPNTRPAGDEAAPAGTGREEDAALVERLRAGDEAAFVDLVDRYHASMVRLAQTFVGDRSVAEEVAQEAWLGVLNGIDRFEGRSSLKTWIFRILTNIARTRGERESRTIAFSNIFQPTDDAEPALPPERFLQQGQSAGFWASPPKDWGVSPEQSLLSSEVLGVIEAAMAKLPPAQREVIRMRDIEGWSSEEVRNVLDLTETNQRVLLHRARSKVRQALEDYFEQKGTT